MTKSILALALLSLPLAACNGRDYYTEVSADCNYRPAPGAYVSYTGDFVPAQIRPKCKAALEAILPYDDSWKGHDAEKDKVTEAFQSIIPFALALPPENRIFGVAPWSIPLWHVRLIEEEETPQKSIFNHVISLIQQIHYDDSPASSLYAQYTPNVDLGGKLTIFKAYVEMDGSYSAAFSRAATIIHEARHGDGYFHNQCATGDFECDNQNGGPYGMEVTYYELLLHGSGNRLAGGSASPLSDVDLETIATQMCATLAFQIDRKPADLIAFLATHSCWSFNASSVTQIEGLVR